MRPWLDHNIKRLASCRSMEQAGPILETLGASDGAKLNFKTGLMLKNSGQEPQSHTYTETAIKELEDLGRFRNHNNGGREDGGHGSSDNTAPYPQPGTYSQDGQRGMMSMQGTMNQWDYNKIAAHINEVVKYNVQKAIHELEKNNISGIKQHINKLYKETNKVKSELRETKHMVNPMHLDLNKDYSRSPFIHSDMKPIAETSIKVFAELPLEAKKQNMKELNEQLITEKNRKIGEAIYG